MHFDAPTDVVRTRPPVHQAVFHAGDEHLAASVARFLEDGFGDGARAAIVLVTRPHAALLENRIGGWREADGRHVELVDAHATLLAILDAHGHVDPARFEAVVARRVRVAAANGPVLVFGELVALLWERDDLAGVLELEALWEELIDQIPIRLLCGYPAVAAPDQDGSEESRTLRDAHDMVVPEPPAARSIDPGDPWAAVARLQDEATLTASENLRLRAEQQRLHARLDEQRAELEELRAAGRRRDRSTAMVAHDIRTPISVISALLELLRSSPDALDDDRLSEFLAAASRSSAQIERLVDDLLLLTRLDADALPLELTRLELHRIAAEEIHAAEELTGRAIDLTMPTELPKVLADAGRQRQILTNLLTNAVRYSDPDTPITVHLEASHDHVRVGVRDEGRGIAEWERTDLFQPFTQLAMTDKHAGGSGLGLTITKALVEAQGGTIEVASEPGSGTTFSYTVPRADRHD